MIPGGLNKITKWEERNMVTVQDILAKNPDELSMEDLTRILESSEVDETTKTHFVISYLLLMNFYRNQSVS